MTSPKYTYTGTAVYDAHHNCLAHASTQADAAHIAIDLSAVDALVDAIRSIRDYGCDHAPGCPQRTIDRAALEGGVPCECGVDKAWDKAERAVRASGRPWSQREVRWVERQVMEGGR